MISYTFSNAKSDGLPQSSNKSNTVRNPLSNKRFEWEVRKTVDVN